MDTLWSDPSDKENMLGFSSNQVRDPEHKNNIVTYGPDVVEKFIKANGISMIIRGHQICQDAIDHFANNQVVTITSCANYCGIYNNDACFMVIQKRLVVSPKIIKPLNTGVTPWQKVGEISAEADASVNRPPTPMRERRETQ